MRVRIIRVSDYVFQTRGIRVGDEFDVECYGDSNSERQGLSYLVRPKNGLPIVFYDGEVVIISV